MSARKVARPEILRGIPRGRHVVIEASAGTGKTFALEHLVVDTILAPDAPRDAGLERLLIVTFTEKATHELRARVRAKLEELQSGGETATSAQIEAGDFWTIDAAAKAKLARSLHAFDAATITTIHAFCQGVLQENAFASGRLFEEQPIDAREAFGRALRDALRQDLAGDPQRARWLEAALATGWSIARIEELLWRCLTAHGELRPAFSADALEAAIASFPIEDARRTTLGVEIKGWGVHANTANAIARRLYALAGAVEPAREANDPPRYLIAAEAIKLGELVEKLKALSPRPSATARLCAAALDLALATPPFPAALAHALLPVVRDVLACTKRESGRYDFDDMLSLVDDALRGPGGGALADGMRRRYRHVFIDEFQDTDETQWSIFRRAFHDVRPSGEPASRVVLVGDPKQSIYRFRGADVQTYLRARHAVLEAGGGGVSLERNYRATPALVEATNALFDQSAAEPMFSGSITYVPVECGRRDRRLVDGDGRAPSAVHVLRFQGDLALATLGARIAREVRLLTNPARPFRLDGRALCPRDIFVLTRTAREGLVIGAALRAADVPHAFYKEEGLFQREEANDVRVLLAAIERPRDRARRLSAWMTPFFGLALADVDRARDLPDAHPLVERLYEWKQLAELRDFDRLFESLLRESGVVRREIFFGSGERSITNYMHLFEALLERARASHKTLADLVGDLAGLRAKTRLPLDLEGNVQRLESETAAVQIMTIHKAKGLEAPVVFMAGGLSPGRADEVRVYHDEGRRLVWVGALSTGVSAAVKEGEREEDQRLMYVALTRAMGRLYLPCLAPGPSSRRPRGPYEPVSRRLAELLVAETPSFTVEDVPPAPAAGTLTVDARAGAVWRPPPELLRDQDAAYDALRAARAGAVLTSYTRMKARRGGARGAWIAKAEDRREESAIEHADEAGATNLRAARASGIFLHELLERVAVASFAESPSFDAWRKRTDVATLVDEAMAVHRVAIAEREHAERLVWSAYTTPMVLPGGDRIEGLSSAARIAREMEFVFPASAPATPGPLAAPSSVRAYVRGSLDLAFEHRGLTYFVDWKSDSLPSFDPDTVRRHVGAHYEEQLRLYALAIVKLLGLGTAAAYDARFGGLLYCFLRGIDGAGGGVFSTRPSFADVVRWDDDVTSGRSWSSGGSS